MSCSGAGGKHETHLQERLAAVFMSLSAKNRPILNIHPWQSGVCELPQSLSNLFLTENFSLKDFRRQQRGNTSELFCFTSKVVDIY